MNQNWGVKSRMYAMLGGLIAFVAVCAYFVTADLLRLMSAVEDTRRSNDYQYLTSQADLALSDLSIHGLEMLNESHADDFKGFEKSRYEALAQFKVVMEGNIDRLTKDAARFDVTASASGFKDTMNTLYSAIETLGTSARTRRLTEEDNIKFEKSMQDLRANGRKHLNQLIDVTSANLISAVERQKVASESLQKTLLGVILTTVFVLIVFGVLNVRRMLGILSNAQSTLGSAIKDMTQTSGFLSEAAQKTSTSASSVSSKLESCIDTLSDLSSRQHQIDKHNLKAKHALREINSKVDEVSRLIGTLNKSIQNGKSFLDRIDPPSPPAQNLKACLQMLEDISRKSQLLSINASIEAVRAGSSGKGFSAIANELSVLHILSGKVINEMTLALRETPSHEPHLQHQLTSELDKLAKISFSAIELTNNIRHTTESVFEKSGEIDRALLSQQRASHFVADLAHHLNRDYEMINGAVRDSAHLGTLLMKQCKQMHYASDQFQVVLHGGIPISNLADIREPIPEAKPNEADQQEIDPRMDKILTLEPSGPSADLSEKTDTQDDEHFKSTGS
jgi:methyl-accepting chemotaxis protein